MVAITAREPPTGLYTKLIDRHLRREKAQGCTKMIKKIKTFPPTKQRLVKVGLDQIAIKTVTKCRKTGDNDLIDKLYRLKSFFGYNRFNAVQIDNQTSIYPTSDDYDLFDELYINELNITPGLKPHDIDTSIVVNTSKENYNNLSYRQKLLNFSKKCRLSGMGPKEVRVEVELFKENYWKG